MLLETEIRTQDLDTENHRWEWRCEKMLITYSSKRLTTIETQLIQLVVCDFGMIGLQ